MKIIQVSDLHLDRPFEGVTKETYLLKKLFLTANQKVYETIIKKAILLKADLVLFCGDTFHQSQIPLKTQKYFLEGLKKLQAENIQVVLTFGNHDFYTTEKFWFPFPENVTLFTKEAVAEKIITLKNQQQVKVVAFSYEHPHLSAKKALEFPAKNPRETLPVIGVYHGQEEENGVYSPFLRSQLKALNYDYIALGHLHVPEVLSFKPLMIMGGTPQSHNKKEVKVKGIVEVELKKNQAANYQFHEVAELEFAAKEVSFTSVTSQEFLTEIMHYLKANSKKTWQILELTGKNFPEKTQEKLVTGELQQYLNETLEKLGIPIFIQELKGKEGFMKEQIPLPLSLQVLKSYQKLYEGVLFQELTQDLQTEGILGDTLNEPTFQKDVLNEALQLITEHFLLEDQ